MSVISIRLNQRMLAELRKISKTEKMSVSDFVRASLEKSLRVEKFNIVRSQVVPFAETLGLYTDEEIFKALK